ncbi:MAG TPA: efflux transporter outer membrane subunit [Povalibacter sp.]|nr:efflux transporter outer membrane subunit [Povalibacter sp.]
MRRTAALLSITTIVCASGCAVAPPPPAEDVRRQALADIALDGTWRADASVSTQPVLDDWISTFHDPALDALVREAIAHNPDLRVAAARVEQAGQYLVIAHSALKPSLGIFGTGGAKSGGGGDTSSALQGALLAASWELDLWGRLRYARNAAREDLAAARAELEFARQSIAASTAKAWFSATQLSLDATVAADMVASARELTSLAEQRARVGAGTDADVAIARASEQQSEDSLQQILLARGQALRALELLIGRYPAAEIAARAELLDRPGPVSAGLPLQMLERRPDVIAAERRVAAAFNRVGEAKAARLPQLSLNASFGAFASDILELKEDFENPTSGIGARLLAPIYQGGRLTAQVEIRTLQQKEAIADYARVALRAIGEVEYALAAGSTLAARTDLLSNALQEQTLALELTRTNLRIGRVDRRALEQQRMAVSNARMALNSVRTDELAGRVNLYLALGGSLEPASE